MLSNSRAAIVFVASTHAHKGKYSMRTRSWGKLILHVTGHEKLLKKSPK
jgi:hypothetical protein